MDKIKKIFKILKNDYSLRVFVIAIFSLLSTVILSIFNLAFGIIHGTSWNIAISFYYLTLVAFRVYIFIFESRMRFKDEKYKEKRRMKNYIVYGIFLLILDITLIWPISLIQLGKKGIYINNIYTIIFATYTFYRLGLAIYNLIKTKKGNYNLSVRLLRILSFSTVLVSIMNLQSMLILSFGSYDKDMMILTTVDSLAIWCLLIGISIYTYRKGIKLKNEEEMNEIEDIISHGPNK